MPSGRVHAVLLVEALGLLQLLLAQRGEPLDLRGGVAVLLLELLAGDSQFLELQQAVGLDILDDEIANLAGNLALVKSGSAAAHITLAQLEEREERRETLAALPSRPDSEDLSDTLSRERF